MLPGRMMIERIAGAVERDIFRQGHRQIFFRHRHRAAALAMDDRNRAAPITLPRNAPIAQPVIDLPLRHGTIVAVFALEPARDLFFGLRAGHAVKKARIDYQPIAVVSGVGDDESLRIDAGRTHHRHITEGVFVDEIQVALVVRRAAENRAGAVVHDDEIGDIDRQRP